MSQQALIIGAGAVGCLSALELARRGWRVTLVDQAGVGSESSWAGGGILFPLLPWHYPEPVNRLALAGAAAYPALCQDLLDNTGIDPQYQVSGMRVLGSQDGALAMAWGRRHGVEMAARAQELWLPAVAQARNPRLMQALRARLPQAGVRLLEHCRMRPLSGAADLISHWADTEGARLEADAYVVTAGAWSAGLLGAKALSLPIKPMRGQMLLYRLAPGTLREILYCEDFYLIPRRDGHILAGSTVEDVGFDKAVTSDAAEDLRRKAQRLLPPLAHAEVIQHWSGLRPGSPDNIPVIAQHPQIRNLFLNAGHFRYGVTMAPASAQLLADLVEGGQQEIGADYGVDAGRNRISEVTAHA